MIGERDFSAYFFYSVLSVYYEDFGEGNSLNVFDIGIKKS